MKKTVFIALIYSATIIPAACGNNNSASNGTHTHDDGSTHGEHTKDTAKPAQQEFNAADTIKKDTSGHTHEDGSKHTH